MNNKIPLSLRISSWLLSLVLIYIILYYFKQILIPIAFATLISLLLYPFCQLLENKGINRVLSIIICLVISLLLLSSLLLIISAQLIDLSSDLPMLIGRFIELLNNIQQYIETTFHVKRTDQLEWIQQHLTGFLESGTVILGKLINATTNFITVLVLVLIYIFLFLLYRDLFKEFILRIAPAKQHSMLKAIIDQTQKVVKNYIIGLATVMLIIAILNSIGLGLLGIKYAIFFGFLAALLNIIPYIGILIGSIFPILMAILTKDSLWYAAGVIFVFGFVQFLEGNFITPRIVGSKVSINPLVAIVSLIVGGQVWGAAGMIIAIPCIAILKVIFDNVGPLKPFGLLLGGEFKTKEKGSMSSNSLLSKIRQIVKL